MVTVDRVAVTLALGLNSSLLAQRVVDQGTGNKTHQKDYSVELIQVMEKVIDKWGRR